MKKGVTLITLMIVIVITLLIAGVVVYNGSDITSYSNMTKFATEILNIQSSVDDYYYIHNVYPIGDETTFDISNVQAETIVQFQSETITDNEIILKKIDFSKIGISNLKYGNNINDMDFYALSETTGKVYYLKGYEYKGKVYYTIDDELYNMTSINETSKLGTNDIKRYDVVFSVNNLEYTALPVEVTIKVPADATINSVTATNSKIVGEETIQNGYKTIKVNESGTSRTGNYTIIVDYTIDKITKQAKYEITNYDANPPTLTTTESIENGIKTITITANDAESGIRNVKYEQSRITDMNHFINYGKIVKNNIVSVIDGAACTIYVEDNAGNSIIKTIE